MAAALAALLVNEAGSQTTRPSSPATAPSTTRPVEGPVQTAEFIELAAKAQKLKGVHIKGKWLLLAPPNKSEVAFEIWAAPPLAKTLMVVPSRHMRLTDGNHVYTYRR
ncbi:hypothetical protein LCGC14_1884120, partial [marine sediment metagenome]